MVRRLEQAEATATRVLDAAWQRAWVAEVLRPMLDAAPSVARADLHEALIVALDIYTWRLLRLDIGHPTEDARRIVVGMIRSLGGGSATRRSRRR